MTYQELKSRLEKCEYALKCIKDGTHKNIDNIDIKQTTQKLTLLKESLIKQMKSLDEGNSKTYLVTPKAGQTSAVSMSDDEIDALKDADDVKAIKGVDGEEIKENVEFSIDETKAIAKKVGEAVAKSLKSLGDDVASMKGRNIEPNSFEIYVQYKNGKDDEFSFYISNDKLNLQDFSFTKELVDVGVKPSGEPIINVDVLVNELNKHFKSLQENKLNLDKEILSYIADTFIQNAKDGEAGYSDFLDLHIGDAVEDVAGILNDPSHKLFNVTRKEYNRVNKDKRKGLFQEGYYDDYKPKHFDICPGATTLRNRVLDGEFGEQEPVVVGKWTELHDELFAIEKLAIKKNFAQDAHVRMANDRRDQIIHLSREMNIPEEAIGYLKGHVDKIIDIGKKSGGVKEMKHPGYSRTKNQYAGRARSGKPSPEEKEKRAKEHQAFLDRLKKVNKKLGLDEAPDDMYYIKVKRTDKASLNGLQDVIETWYAPVRFADIVDDDGAGNVIFYIKKEDWDPGMEDDIMGNGVQIYDTNMPLSEGEKETDGADTDYAKRRKEGDDYYEDPDYYKEEKETDDYGRPHVDPKGSRTFLEPDEMLPHNRFKKMVNKNENESEDQGGDLDIGHQDDEPDMLKQHAYDIAQYASKLYKALDKYDKYDGEVDFPNWWQSKLILARDYISKAQHYLEFEEKQPAIDQLALENVDKVAGGIPYKREGNKFIITEPLDDATKERIMKRAKEHGHHAAPNQAGGVTIMAKEGKYKSDAQRKAIYATKAEKGELDENVDQEQAIYDLRAIVEKAEELGEEARDIVKQYFPNEMSRMDGYGVFNLVYSNNRYDTTLGSEVDRLEGGDYDDLDDDNYPTEGLDSEMPKGKHSIADLQKVHGMIVSKMKELAKLYKEKGGEFEYKGHSVLVHLKSLTNKKKQVEDALDKAVANKDRGQELDTSINEATDLYNRNGIQITRFAGKGGLMVQINYGGKYIHVPADEFAILSRAMQSVIGDIRDMTLQMPRKDYPKNEAELDKKEKKQVKKIVKQLKKSVKGHGDQAKYLDKLSKESAPGYKHDCASKVVHEKYGKGTCIPEKHTLVKEGNKYVVTHYDVLFENGNTVLDIPVSELEIKTQTEHWHKGYKKKKK